MNRLAEYKQALYEIRISPMCKPAGEVSNLTQLESHTTRAHMMMFWRVVEDIISWDTRGVELVYQSTLDSISEAFDVFHYPVSQYMLAARADIWDAGLAPEPVKQAVEDHSQSAVTVAPKANTLLLAGEIAQLGRDSLLAPLQAALRHADVEAAAWVTFTGALAYALGAQEAARQMAAQVAEGIKASGAATVIVDGPETAWALTKIYPALGVTLPDGVKVKLLSVVLAEQAGFPSPQNLGPVMVHDSRPACLIADAMANNLAVMPGYHEDESAFGQGLVYDAPRQLVEKLGGQRVYGTWTRSLAKTSGADDGLWLTYPNLANGLAHQRLDYTLRLGAKTIVTDSPLAAAFLKERINGRNLKVAMLAELLT